MGQPSVVDLFPTPLQQWDIGQPELIEALLAEVMAARPGKRSMGAERVDVDFLNGASPTHAEFQKVLHQAVSHFIKFLAIKKVELPAYTARSNAWVINSGDFLAPWEASRNDLSGIIYLDTGDGPSFDIRGFLEFLDPRVAVKQLPGRRLSVNVRVTPQAGLMLLYPSWFRRLLYPYEGVKPRVLLDFDIRFRKLESDEAPEGFLDDR